MWEYKDGIIIERNPYKSGLLDYQTLTVKDKETGAVILVLDDKNDDEYFPSERTMEEGGYCMFEWVESNYIEALEEYFKNKN